ncbi:MAG: carbohydrate ABC transporter permease [Chloroflexaceae bacterium]|nr:carbohydrate ABC transporter permease [Chloroflexaceae bacterium]
MNSQRLTRWQQLKTQAQLALAGLFVLLPVLWLVRLAFDGTILTRPKDFALIPNQWTWANLAQAWAEPRGGTTFLELLRNSLLVSGGTALVALLIGATAAYAFARFRFPGRRAGLFGALVLVTLPPAGLIAPFFLYLSALRIRTTLLGLVVVYSAIAVPFALWTLRNAMQGVPLELEEAAMLDGATRWTVFRRITLPLVAPSAAVAGFIAFVLAWSEFALGWAFVSDPNQVTLAMAINGMRDANSVSWGLLSATALLVTLPVVVIFYALGSTVINGLSLGAAGGVTSDE